MVHTSKPRKPNEKDSKLISFSKRTKASLTLRCLSIGSMKQTKVIRFNMVPHFGIPLSAQWDASRTQIPRPYTFRIRMEWNRIELIFESITLRLRSPLLWMELGARIRAMRGSLERSKQTGKQVSQCHANSLYVVILAWIHQFRKNEEPQRRMNAFHFQHFIILTKGASALTTNMLTDIHFVVFGSFIFDTKITSCQNHEQYQNKIFVNYFQGFEQMNSIDFWNVDVNWSNHLQN